jgi:hypothetical protein
MARNKRSLLRKVLGGFATAVVLAVLTAPAVLTVWWLYKAVTSHA